MVLKITKDNFEEEILNSSLPVVIDFYADWCNPCQMMGPVFEELSKEFEGKAKFVKIDTQNNPELSSSWQVSSIPTISIIEGKKEKGRLMGFSPKEVLREEIQKALDRN